jgi:hypothetical protein
VSAGALAWWKWLLPILFGSPWIVAIVWYGRRLRSEGGGLELPPSVAELARRRLWTR